jgi:hypothetical protein
VRRFASYIFGTFNKKMKTSEAQVKTRKQSNLILLGPHLVYT